MKKAGLLTNYGLYTDFYELTMAQAYYYNGMHEKKAVFDYFFRSMPCGNGYVVFAGLSDLLHALESFIYSEEELDYLERLGFKPAFLSYLQNFKFRGEIIAPREGEIIFNNEPVVTVRGSIIETQLIESLLLNFLNFQSLIATRASRIESVLQPHQSFMDFGLRRAQGWASLHASRAAVIGGAIGTSNTEAARRYHLQAIGTMAHSWIQAFDDELQAFRAYAQVYPDKATLLVDTYDTLKSGVPNAIQVAKELEREGYKLHAIRIDSGDMAFLSRQARRMLDEAGLKYIKIIASNSLDEFLIRSLNLQKAQLDGFGVGTKLAVSKGCPALDGVYKLAWFDGQPRLKISEDIAKISLPGNKELYRIYDDKNMFYRDAIILEGEKIDKVDIIYHPDYAFKNTVIKNLKYEKLRHPVMRNGKILNIEEDVHRISEFRKKRLKRVPEETKRFENPHIYKVGISKKLFDLRQTLIQKFLSK